MNEIIDYLKCLSTAILAAFYLPVYMGPYGPGCSLGGFSLRLMIVPYCDGKCLVPGGGQW